MTDFEAIIQPDDGSDATSIILVSKETFDAWLSTRPQSERMALAAQEFDGDRGSHAVLSCGPNNIINIVAGVDDPDELKHWSLAKLAENLPPGRYRLDGSSAGQAIFGWMMAHYYFDEYRSDPEAKAPRILLIHQPGRIAAAALAAQATAMVRDMVNRPAADMGPPAMEAAVKTLADTYGGTCVVTSGEALEKGYPLIHAVGRAATREHAPRLIELEWGDERHPRIAIVGKGVAFDSGGLSMKSVAGMRIMKKDMGGAAHAIALAKMIMASHLPVRLHLLVAAVENCVAGNALRPGDVVKSRKGITVEIDNTDAEGRLVLADAMAKAVEDGAVEMIDFATLTGAARVALGPDLPPLFCTNDDMAEAILAAAKEAEDPLWRMPLWAPYEDMLNSDIADTANSGGSFAGAITAALFMEKFTQEDVAWAHIDTYAWRPSNKAGRPKGGEALGLRAVFGYLAQKYPAR